MPLRVGAAGLTVAGALLGGDMAATLAGGPFSVWAFVLAMVLAGLCLPVVVRRLDVGPTWLAMGATVTVLIGLGFVLLFNMRLVVSLTDWIGMNVFESALGIGRKAAQLLIGGGLAGLAVAWSRILDEFPVRAALALVGVAGVVLAFRPEGRAQGVWYLALGALWLYLGLATLLDARRPTST